MNDTGSDECGGSGVGGKRGGETRKHQTCAFARLAVVALEVQVHPLSEAVDAEGCAVEADHLRALLVDGAAGEKMKTF